MINRFAALSVVAALGAVGLAFLLILQYGAALWHSLSYCYGVITDREKVEALVNSFGVGAPLIFMGIQVLQVLLAPIPGEATGYIGGYLFGAGKGFVYSSIALTGGSVLNFSVGRFLGKRYVRKLIPVQQLRKFDRTLKRQGVIVVFILFIFPGFPKDYLCFFLGLSALPLKVFVFLTAVGRMPGTFLLSLQGAYHYEQKYGLLAVMLGVCLLIGLLGYRYREAVYRWIERYNNTG